MADLQATIEFSVELYKFFNVDLFQRGLYQVRCALRVSPRLPVQVETSIPEATATQNQPPTQSPPKSELSSAEQQPPQQQQQDLALHSALPGSACIINGMGASRVFQILYRNEEVALRDVVHFRAHLLVDSRHPKESIERAEFSLLLELWFGEQNGSSSLSLASSRNLHLNFHPGRGLHYHLPVLFDYFHLAAVSVGIHASLVALHQPYINAPKSSKPWISSSKLSCRGSMSPGPLEAVFFGPAVGGTTKCSGGPAGRLLQSRQIHREVCSLLLGAIENLKATINEFSSVLTPNMNMQIGGPPLRENDTCERLQQITEQAKLHDSEEDFAIRANSDIAQLCAESIMYWRRVLVASTQQSVHTLLAKKHHILRVRRFAEGFFVMENPRHSAAGCYDSNYQNYVAIAEAARRSRYMQSLPPLPVHCTPIDGDTNSIPLIFEDRYVEPPNYMRRRTGSDPHLSSHESVAGSASKTSCAANLLHVDKTQSINSLNGRAKECLCGISYDYPSSAKSVTGVLTPRFALGGEILQASLTIAPAVAAKAPNGVIHKRHTSRHSVTGLLDDADGDLETDKPFYAVRSGTLPTRHSKSLDQLDGQVHSTPSLRTQPPNQAQKSTAIDSNYRHLNGSSKTRVQAEDLMRNISEFRLKYKNSEDIARLACGGRTSSCYGNASVKECHKSIGGTLKCQTEAQPRAGKFDYLHEIKMLNPPKQLHGRSQSYYNSLPKSIANGVVLPRNSYPPVTAKHMITLATDAAVQHTQAPIDQHPIPRSNSSQTLRHKSCPDNELISASTIPRSVEIARVRVSDLKEMLKNGTFRKESSSSESDLPSKVRKAKADQKILSSTSVPFKLESYKTTTLDDTEQSANGFSESLPNLAPPPQFDADAQKRHNFMSNSTSSLSEESGWVSSRRSSCGPSSPETITNGEKTRQANSSGMETKLNGEQLRLKLQKLLEQQNKSKKQRHPSLAAQQRKSAATANNASVALHKKVSSVTLVMNAERNKTDLSLHRHLHQLPNSESTEVEDSERPQPPRRERSRHGKHEKSKSDFDLKNLKDLSAFENVRVPPPQQFQDDLLPPDEFRDPPAAQSTKPTPTENNPKLPGKLHTPKPRPKHHNKSPSISPKKMATPAPTSAPQPLKEILPLPPPALLQRQPIGAIDNPVYHIYESLKPMATPAIFTNKPVPKAHSIVELRRNRELLSSYLQQNGKTPQLPPPTAPINGIVDAYEVHSSLYNGHNGHAAALCNDDEDKENSHTHSHSHGHSHSNSTAHSSQIIARSDSQKSTSSKSKRKGHESSVSLLEFEKYREEFRKQVKYTGFIYSDFAKLASELPYFYISDEYRAFSPHGMHLIVCVHGLDGNSADLRLVRTYLELGLPGANLEFLMSERNQGDTFSDFDTMTDRLVGEVLYHIESCGLNPTRISFVAHSLGTIIVRSALARPQMRPLLPRLHTFLSLSGPHLGTLYNTSGLVNMGLWFMQKWKKSGSLLQLCMRDTSDLRNSFLYRLSQRSTLHHFKHILLCGSSQDRYVPAHSARLELCKAAMRDNSNLGVVYREMVHNIIAPILARPQLTLARYDIHHALPHTANTLIGRAAHIAVLDSELFIEKFFLIAGLKYFS